MMDTKKAPTGPTASASADAVPSIETLLGDTEQNQSKCALSVPQPQSNCNQNQLYTNIPDELKSAPNWVFCGNDKIPRKVNGGMAKAGDPSTWTDFNAAVTAASLMHNGRIGYMFNDDGIVGVDLDNVRDPNTGEIVLWALDIIQRLNSYTEISMSGKGVHIFARGVLPPKHRCKVSVNGKQHIEIYHEKRYFAMTGEVLHGNAIEYRQDELTEIYEQYFGSNSPQTGSPQVGTPLSGTTQILHPPMAMPPVGTPSGGASPVAGNSGVPNISASEYEAMRPLLEKYPKFSALWHGVRMSSDESSMDMSLMNYFAICFNADTHLMISVFLTSRFCQTKDAKHQMKIQRADYLQGTADKAVQFTWMKRHRHLGMDDKIAEFSERIGKFIDDIQPNTKYKWDDIGFSRLFADAIKDFARYCDERKKWFIYDGRIWVPDSGGIIAKICKVFVERLREYSAKVPDSDEVSYVKYVKEKTKYNKRKDVIKDAQSEHRIKFSDLDANPHLLNCLNVTLNLETSEFYPHRADDMLTKLAGVEYDPLAVCGRWELFVNEIMCGDEECIAFFQQALGYALTGDNRYECFFILYGPTSRNGKGTAMETFTQMMGGYARATRPETLAAKDKANGGAPSEDLARLAGARFVNVSEPDKSLQLNSAMVKSMTGNDTITVRYLHENSFEYRPVFKLFINTNYLPQTNDPTLFSSDRVHVILFNRHFKDEERDKGLKQFLLEPENLSGILNWALDGLSNLRRKNGFCVPAAVKQATDEYREASDKTARFVDEHLNFNPGFAASTTLAHERYKSWCEREGVRAEGMQNFMAGLKRMGLVIKRPRVNGKQVTSITDYELVW